VAYVDGASKFCFVRWPSRAVRNIVDVVNDRGVRIRGKKLTDVQVDSWDEQGAFEGKVTSHPGRPEGGSEVSYPEETIDVVEGLAMALDQSPRSFSRAVLVVAGRELSIGTPALRRAYSAAYGDLRDVLWNARQHARRVRLPSGVLAGRLDCLARNTLFELAFNEVPVSYGIDALVEALGLPSDLRTFPPDPEAREYPTFVEISRSSLALQELRKVGRTAVRDDLKWATSSLRTLLCFVVSLATYVDLTGSPLPIVSDPDPAVVASSQHVLRTLTTGGRALVRLIEGAGAGSAEYLAAFAAPMLLVMLKALPERARTDFQDSIDRASVQLPRLLAVVSLVDSADPKLRHLMSFNAAERLQDATDEERAAVRRIVSTWGEAHREQMPLLATPTVELPIDESYPTSCDTPHDRPRGYVANGG
jgi:hypothetical protein